jgi:hypothetical protein
MCDICKDIGAARTFPDLWARYEAHWNAGMGTVLQRRILHWDFLPPRAVRLICVGFRRGSSDVTTSKAFLIFFSIDIIIFTIRHLAGRLTNELSWDVVMDHLGTGLRKYLRALDLADTRDRSVKTVLSCIVSAETKRLVLRLRRKLRPPAGVKRFHLDNSSPMYQDFLLENLMKFVSRRNGPERATPLLAFLLGMLRRVTSLPDFITKFLMTMNLGGAGPFDERLSRLLDEYRGMKWREPWPIKN